MKILSPLRLLTGLIACSVISVPAWADDAPGAAASNSHGAGAQGFHFEIAGGVIVDHFANGKPMPATLNNVVGIARDFYPDEMIAQIGVGDVPIGDILMQSRLLPSSGAFFTALAMASKGQFRCETPSGSVLLAPTQAGPGGTPRIVNVFNLSRYLNGQKEALEAPLKELEGRKKVLGERFTDTHPDMVSITDEISIVKARMAAEQHSPEEVKDLLERLKKTATEMLATVSPQATPPEISFNQSNNLLIVYGTPDAVDVVSKVIAAVVYN